MTDSLLPPESPDDECSTATPYTDGELADRGLTREQLPRHVAFIMDGNGRWAEQQGQPRAVGHARGADTVEHLVEETARLGLEQITLYCFSQENWKRPEPEQAFLFDLLEQYVVGQRERIARQRLQFATIGEITRLPESVQHEIEVTRQLSETNRGMRLCLALNYGARQEISSAVREIVAAAKNDELSIDEIDDRTISRYLDTAGMPDPDLVVRTAGEMRLSNFLLWQLSYAEIWVTDEYWPDFREPHLHAALRSFAQRERRFGAVKPLPQSSATDVT